MENTIKIDLLETISTIFEKSENSKLNPTLFTELKPELDIIASHFIISETQAFILSIIFALNYKKTNTINFSEISTHLDSNPVRLLKYNKELDFLYDNDFIIKEASSFNFNVAYADSEYTVTKGVSKSIIENIEYKLEVQEYNSVIDVLEELILLIESFSDEKINILMMRRKVERLLFKENKLKFFNKIKLLDLTFNFQLMYLLLIWETLIGNRSIDIERTADRFLKSPRMKIKLVQDFNNKDINKLVLLDLVELEEESFINDTRMKLSKKSLDILEKEGIKLFKEVEKKKDENTILHNEIVKVKMYYNSREEEQITMLHNALKERKYKELQTRLMQKNLPSGITALFYGYPGTGKTESVLQIARQTGRDIMKVDISQTKSKWFGDSEKIIKKIFTKYREFKHSSKKAPILLFNEADAVISKRKDSSSSNVVQTENAIQNIILEELENFEGIFVATTNLADNLDTAFERRFLFKVEFHKPDIEVKAKIWKVKLKDLKHNEYVQLAIKYDFTGGQINNIVRKCEMAEVLENTKITFDKVQAFCEEETINKKSNNKVGFL